MTSNIDAPDSGISGMVIERTGPSTKYDVDYSLIPL